MRSSLVGLIALCAGCSAPSPSAHTADAGPSARADTAPPPRGSAAGGAGPATPAAHDERRDDGPLAHFYGALRELEHDKRDEHVRILWLGDSHAQADFWPDAIRKGLQGRFGNGGLGFLHVGMDGYRHAGVRFDIKGKWRMRPKMPSTIQPWPGGALGLGGILHAGFAGARSVTMTLTDERLKDKKLRLDLCYRHGLKNDVFELQIGDGAWETIQPQGVLGQLTHIERAAVGQTTVRLRVKDGRPDFCGLVVETDPEAGAGVVLDNLGINGARYATALAWDEKSWAAEVQRRPPQLVVFEYGGNEAGDGVVKPEKYKQNALDLIARARRVAPEASCLVIAPTDRVDAEVRVKQVVEIMKAAAAESGCSFWNSYEEMGGRGALRLWRDDGRAAEDGVHLMMHGYAEVGALMLEDMMRDYRP